MAVEISARDDGRLAVAFPYSAERVEKIKTIPGRRWHPEEKVWTVPAGEGMAERLRKLFADEAVDAESSLVPICKKIGEELRLGGYSAKTGKTYLHHCRRYLRHIGKDHWWRNRQISGTISCI